MEGPSGQITTTKSPLKPIEI